MLDKFKLIIKLHNSLQRITNPATNEKLANRSGRNQLLEQEYLETDRSPRTDTVVSQMVEHKQSSRLRKVRYERKVVSSAN